MKLRTARSLFVGIAVATAGLTACSSGPNQTPSSGTVAPEGTGTIGLNLQVAPGISISTVNWTIHNAALLAADLTGSVDVSQSQAIQFIVGGLPAGDGYTITLTATTDGPNPLTCVGSGTFSIVANSSSPVNVTLVCSRGTGAVDAGNNGSVVVIVTPTVPPLCAVVTSLSASPSTVDVGGSILLAAVGIDSSGSSSTVGFSWAITGGTGTGTFSSTTSASPTFMCTGAGGVTVTVTATSSGGASCTNNTGSVALMCTAPGGADSGAAAEASAADEATQDTGTADAGAPDTGATADAGAADSGTSDTGTAEAGAPDSGAPDTAAPDTGTPDTGSPDTGATEAGATETGATDTGTADASDSGGTVTTQSILAAQGSACLPCVQTNGCFDPALQGGTCELLSGALTHFAGALPDGLTCAAVLGTEPVSEQQVCLQTLQLIFSSKCGATSQLTPCLCGTTDPTQCTAGAVTPNGPAYDEYSCDFDTTSGATINTDFIVPTFGAGMADSVAQCAGAFSCPCF
jgi:hypothetical protein